MARDLKETAMWCFIRDAAIRGLESFIAMEQAGIEVNKRLGVDYQDRLARISNYEDALKVAEAWRPLVDLPRSVTVPAKRSK